MSRIRSLAPALALLSAGMLAALPAVPLAAQEIIRAERRTGSPTLTLEGNVLYSSLGGRDFAGSAEGVGFDALASLGVDAFALAGGYSRTVHSSSGSDLTLQGFFLEPRLALPFAYENFTPYLFGRISRMRETRDQTSGEREAWGTGLGGGLGVLVRVVPGVHLNMAASYSGMRFGDFELNGTRAPNSGSRGNSFGIRAGLAFGLGGWGAR